MGESGIVGRSPHGLVVAGEADLDGRTAVVEDDDIPPRPHALGVYWTDLPLACFGWHLDCLA